MKTIAVFMLFLTSSLSADVVKVWKFPQGELNLLSNEFPVSGKPDLPSISRLGLWFRSSKPLGGDMSFYSEVKDLARLIEVVSLARKNGGLREGSVSVPWSTHARIIFGDAGMKMRFADRADWEFSMSWSESIDLAEAINQRYKMNRDTDRKRLDKHSRKSLKK